MSGINSEIVTLNAIESSQRAAETHETTRGDAVVAGDDENAKLGAV